MPDLSVITAVDPADAQRLPAAAQSVRSLIRVMQDAGHRVEWVVVVDGPEPLPRFSSTETTRMLRLPRRAGMAACLNHATTAASSPWLMPLLVDDVALAPGIKEALAKARSTNVMWAAGNSIDESGARGSAWNPAAVDVPPGELASAWAQGVHVPSRSLLVQRSGVLTMGGWPALGDLSIEAAVLMLSEHGQGLLTPEVMTRAIAAPRADETVKASAWTLMQLLDTRRDLFSRRPIGKPGRPVANVW